MCARAEIGGSQYVDRAAEVLKIVISRSSWRGSARAYLSLNHTHHLFRPLERRVERSSGPREFQIPDWIQSVGFFQIWDSFWFSISRWFSSQTNLTFLDLIQEFLSFIWSVLLRVWWVFFDVLERVLNSWVEIHTSKSLILHIQECSLRWDPKINT